MRCIFVFIRLALPFVQLSLSKYLLKLNVNDNRTLYTIVTRNECQKSNFINENWQYAGTTFSLLFPICFCLNGVKKQHQNVQWTSASLCEFIDGFDGKREEWGATTHFIVLIIIPCGKKHSIIMSNLRKKKQKHYYILYAWFRFRITEVNVINQSSRVISCFLWM